MNLKHRLLIVFSVLLLLVVRFTMAALNPYPNDIENYQTIQPASEHDFYEALSMLAPDTIGKTPSQSLDALTQNIASEGIHMGYEPTKLAAMVIPSSGHMLAMLIDDDDSEEYQNLEGISYPATQYYQRIASLHEETGSLRPRYEIVFDTLYRALEQFMPATAQRWPGENEGVWRGDVTLPHLFTFPRLQDLEYSHTFALDIFLKNVEYLPGDVQKGPMIHSMSDGIVVVAESGWIGFPRMSQEFSFIEGGLSPKSGNGVIIYSPAEHRYYSYFHLYDVLVETGQLVRRGQPIGHGGNTGINARKKGGGDHLHMEIFDARVGKPLRNTQIISFLKESSRKGAGVSLE